VTARRSHGPSPWFESTRPDHREQAEHLVLALMHHAEPQGRHQTLRVGITGVPGVGKSTAIEALGMYLIERGHRVAVLAVDPSSTRTGGSILGDKTRMAKLAVHPTPTYPPLADVRNAWGVAKATREAIVLLEAAGFDVVLVETVGVGQSEVTVANMVDTFVFPDLGAHRRSATGHQERRARAGRCRAPFG
jgi:LAO/AO transport system kinase